MSPKTIAHFQILEKLGEGGMGVVYKAMDPRLSRVVAIKVLPPDRLANQERKQRFIQEARAASALNHPNIVTIYDIGEDDGVDYIVMEFVPGQTLGVVIGSRPLAPAILMKYAVQIADGMAAAHKIGITHRDLKPGNIIVGEEGRVKLLDFGLAKLTEQNLSKPEDATLTANLSTLPGVIMGTPSYMSPEQAEGRNADARSDIFSMGAILYEMATGQRAFQGTSAVSTLSAVINETPRPVTEIRKEPCRELDRIIRQCLRKDPNRRFQHMDDVRIELESLAEEGELVERSTVQAAQPRPLMRWVAGFVLLSLVAFGSWRLSRPSDSGRPPLAIRRISINAGLARDPAISPDGKLVAYSSDHAGQGNLDIWVQQTDGGNAIRITRDAADEIEPCFSPDGTQIAFRSEGEGGGIHVVPALGTGEPRLLTPKGRSPRYSPDGKQILFWRGEQHSGGAQAFLIPASGGDATQLVASRTTQAPIWSSDGKRIIFATRTNLGSDWAVKDLKGGEPVVVGMAPSFEKFKMGRTTSPGAWLGDQIVFSAAVGDNENLWRIRLSPDTWKPVGDPERVTFGAGSERQPSLSLSGQMVFSSLSVNANLWSIPFDPNAGKLTGPPVQLTSDASMEFEPQLSADGKRLVYTSFRAGNSDIWFYDLESGRQIPIASSPLAERRPAISRDGSKVAYALATPSGSVRMVRLTGGREAVRASAPEKICEACSTPHSWSPDGNYLAYTSPNPARAIVVEPATGKEWTAVPRALQFFQWSPDGQRVSFHVSLPDARQVFVTPFRAGRELAPQPEWVPIFDGKGMDREATWSLNGELLFFFSERDGYRCVWVQRLDKTTKRPVGEPFDLYHAHGSRASLSELPDNLWSNPAFAKDKMVVSLGEKSGSIWIADLGEGYLR